MKYCLSLLILLSYFNVNAMQTIKLSKQDREKLEKLELSDDDQDNKGIKSALMDEDQNFEYYPDTWVTILEDDILQDDEVIEKPKKSCWSRFKRAFLSCLTYCKPGLAYYGEGIAGRGYSGMEWQ